MSKKSKYITVLIAPEIPTSECKHLKAHWQEAVLDPDYSVVLNYECRVNLVPTPRNAQYLVIAPGIPVSEIEALRKQIDKARKAKKLEDRIVVCNYEMRLDIVSA